MLVYTMTIGINVDLKKEFLHLVVQGIVKNN
jgi:hypothetical protein